ncbi:hypothetical protein CKSOR_00047 [Candidatus Kinetoplastibacterium sorsogonicusi]|uniref:PDZ domain-containing protein n=1 Tax=Candidatus Kinetoplastidibacterium kentomonadis TaxID=1576550 RepID=A0A3S7J938_9PROT|nr:PDZ domain-containing protein [Candidatus Kinetoplastibacterium sorsogonicusi]AWD32192.1 hypothetical protein CKSOR_00047 [Candidatus Kinetoplastibacterium sorsogonicusi]
MINNHYLIELYDLNAHKYKITIQINKPNENIQELLAPTWIPGSYVIRDFAKYIENIKAYSNNKIIKIIKKDNHSWYIEKCTSPIIIEYLVYAFDLSVRGSYIDTEGCFFNGTNLFLIVKNQIDDPLTLTIKKINDWKIYTSIDKIPNKYNCLKDNITKFYFRNYDELVDHPISIGNFKCSSFQAYGALHKILFIGRIPKNLNIEKITNDIKKICESQIIFFDKQNKKAAFLDRYNSYLFIIIDSDKYSGGLEHRSSCAIMINYRYLPIKHKCLHEKYINFLSIVSHEYFHTWHIKRIKPHKFINYDFQKPNLTKLLWIFEGFTSYYESIFLLKTNIINYEQYLNIISNNINYLLNNSGRFKQSLTESSFDAWIKYYKQDENSINSIVSYYIKGSLIALGLDSEIRKSSNKSLDDLLLFMWEKYGKNFYKDKKNGILENNIEDLITKAVGINVKEFIDKYVEGTKEIPIKKWLGTFGINLLLENKLNISANTIGMLLKQIDESVTVYSVLENSIAMISGISNGDILLSIDYRKIVNIDDVSYLLTQYNINDSIILHVFHKNYLKKIRLLLCKDKLIRKCFLSKT